MESAIVILLILILPAAIYLLNLWGRKQQTKYETETRRKEMFFESTKNNYLTALDQLKNNPSNANLKQNTLLLGREYSALTRHSLGQNKAVTIYDEIALMNDINAACAGAATNSQMVEQRLAKLSKLKENNLISEHEYNERRQKILDEI